MAAHSECPARARHHNERPAQQWETDWHSWLQQVPDREISPTSVVVKQWRLAATTILSTKFVFLNLRLNWFMENCGLPLLCKNLCDRPNLQSNSFERPTEPAKSLILGSKLSIIPQTVDCWVYVTCTKWLIHIQLDSWCWNLSTWMWHVRSMSYTAWNKRHCLTIQLARPYEKVLKTCYYKEWTFISAFAKSVNYKSELVLQYYECCSGLWIVDPCKPNNNL